MMYLEGELCFGHRVLPIEVTEGTRRLRLSGTTVKKGFLYGYLYDPAGSLRANVLWEKAPKHLCIGDGEYGFGAIPGKLVAGRWTLHLYNLEGEARPPKPMQYRIACEFDGGRAGAPPLPTVPVLGGDNQVVFDYGTLRCGDSRWYRGDFHAHTQLSDGHNDLATAVALAEMQTLDFLFLTEHNICHTALPSDSHTLFLPAIEITTDLGHFNVHAPRCGLDMQDADYGSAALIGQGMDNVAGPGSNISINHAMMTPWHWQYGQLALSRVNTIEICCDPTWPTAARATEQALVVMSAMWNVGHRIFGIGGSDAHLGIDERNPKASEPSVYGDPATYVYSHGLGGERLVSAMHRGHIYLERRCGLAFEITAGDCPLLPGDDAGGATVSFSLSVSDSHRGYVAEIIADGRCITTVPLSCATEAVDIDMADHAWVRVDIRRQDGSFEGLINPVYNSTRGHFSSPALATWGELMAVTEEKLTETRNDD